MRELLFTTLNLLFLPILCSACDASLIQPPPVEETVVTVTYQPSNDLFPNPERGFYHHTDTLQGEASNEGNPYVPLDPNGLQDELAQDHRQDRDITLILRVFYLDEFVDTTPDCLSDSDSCTEIDISPEYLEQMQEDFDTIRAAGIKAIVRFAYANRLDQDPNCSADQWCPVPPYRDASKAQVLAHLTQLQPLLEANRDVITVVQAGFIGTWGEWYYTDHFVDDPADPGLVTDEMYGERGEVLTATLAAITEERMVQVRTPLHKQQLFRTGSDPSAALSSPGDAYSPLGIARTGHHNDCFLADDTDFGTYTNIMQDKAYLAQETKYVPMGGETCNDVLSTVWYSPTLPMPSGPPGGWVRLDPESSAEVAYPPDEWETTTRSLCPTALAELERFHWSYLNIDYHRGVLEKWDTGVTPHDCLAYVQQRLGYRFALLQGIYSTAVSPGGGISVTLSVTNTGWAAPYNDRPAELLLRHDNELYVVQLPKSSANPRTWLPGEDAEYTIAETICTPANMPPGDYELLLHLPDAAPSLSARPEYAIRLANSNVWEATTGYNKLNHTVTVSDALSSAPCNGPLIFAVDSN